MLTLCSVFLLKGGGKQSPVPLWHLVSIATASDRERGVGLEGLEPADRLRLQFTLPRPVRKEKDFEREIEKFASIILP